MTATTPGTAIVPARLPQPPRPTVVPAANGPARPPHRPRAPRGPIRLPPRRPSGRRQQPSLAEVWLRRGGPLAAVLACFAGAALVVPTMTAAGIGDDWVYVRSVEILLRDGDLRILDLSVVTLIFQVVWGAAFALLFADDHGIFGALRLSTVAITGLGGAGLYGLCRELGVRRGRAALGAAAYLFNPLAFGLGFSFMTDPHFAALATIATFGYARGVRPNLAPRAAELALVGGSVAAACAFLVRQQGALIPLAVGLFLLLARRLRWDRASLLLLLRVGAIPAVALVGYYLWLFNVHGVPEQQESFTRTLIDAGWGAGWTLTWRIAVIEAFYAGFFVLPLAVAALGALAPLVRLRGRFGWWLVAAWAVFLAAGLRYFDAFGFDLPPMPRMPYVPQYLGPTGVGPADLVGGRPWLVGWWALDLATALCAVAALLLGLILARRLARPGAPDPTRAVAGVVLLIALGQAAGVLPPSFHFRNWIISVDRYLLPLLPLALALALWGLRGVRLPLGAAWTTVVLFGLFATMATRDFLVLQSATWDLAYWATTQGVPLTRLVGGASWDGYYLYEYGLERGIDQTDPTVPWWVDLFAPATDGSWVVASAPQAGYDVAGVLDYSAWLTDDQTTLYLLRRHGVPGPP